MDGVTTHAEASWMADHAEAIGGKRLTQLTLPGSHDSGAFDFIAEYLDERLSAGVRRIHTIDNYLKHRRGPFAVAGRAADAMLTKSVVGWSRTQNVDIRAQLDAGVRWLDLRALMYHGVPHLYHGFVAHPVQEALDQVRAFTDAHPKEIVLLSFSEMETLTASDHQDLARAIKATIGAERICPSLADFQDKTVAELQTQGTRVVVFYAADIDRREELPWLLDQRACYYPVSTVTNKVERLIAGIDRVMAQRVDPRPAYVGFTTTPKPHDITRATLRLLAPRRGGHDLYRFTDHVRGMLPMWFAARSGLPLGVVSTDFVQESTLWSDCLRHMGLQPDRRAAARLDPRP